jgi:hypothetical protein
MKKLMVATAAILALGITGSGQPRPIRRPCADDDADAEHPVQTSPVALPESQVNRHNNS